MPRSIADTFRRIIIANELGGKPGVALRFSDPDGVRSGKSGWSFGVCQFDVANNPLAAKCLLDCGFSLAEVDALRAQTIDVTPLHARLRQHAVTIAKYDERQLTGCLQRASHLCEKHGIELLSEVALLSLADYHNQYYLSDINKPGYLIHYLAQLGRQVTSLDVLDFKLYHTAYGKKRPKDCRRRFDNIIRICSEATP
ncbi:MAG: hypothetical protein V1791_06800 [Pseudomonadota bacterium]